MNLYFKILFMIVISVFPLAAQNVFQIKLHISKPVYIVGEPVQVGISFMNNSNMIIQNEPIGHIQLKLIDENGKDVKRGGWSHPFWGPYKNKLAPGEEDYYVYLLNNFFGKDFPGFMVAKQYDPGMYTIKVEFFPQNESYARVSDNVSFEVVDPPVEELIVYNRFVDILKRESLDKLTKQDVIQTTIDLRSLYETYPNSVYSPYLLGKLDALYGIPLADRDNSAWAVKELVEKHSSSVDAIYQLNWLMDQMSSESEKIEYIKRIKTKSKGTLMEKMYEKRIGELEKK